MKTHFLAVLVALVMAPFAAFGADEENPFKKVKVGDYAVYKMSMKVGGSVASEGQISLTVKAKDDKEATVKISTDYIQEEREIDLTKKSHPATIVEVLLGIWPPAKAVNFEKLKSGEEKLRVGGKEYDCKWVTFRVTVKKDGLEKEKKEDIEEIEMKVWQSKEFALGMIKTEMLTGFGRVKDLHTWELTESGNKKKD